MKLKMYWLEVINILAIIVCVLVFFKATIVSGRLPIPSDTLSGMYHPWLDEIAKEYTSGLPFKNYLITDPIRQQIPWRKQVIDSFKSGVMPYWNAMSFSGTPLLANIQSAALYPLNIIFFIMPFLTAWSILIISQPLLASIFMYLFLRNKQLDMIPSVFGGILFAFCGFSIAWLTWGTIVSAIAWLPLILLSFDKIHNSPHKAWWRFLFVLAIVCAFFAGHIQVFIYSIAVLFGYAAIQMRKGKLLSFSFFHVGMAGIILFITAPVWFRFIEFLFQTGRVEGANWHADGFFIPARHLIQFIAPDYFGNPTTLNYWGTWNYGEMLGYIGIVGLFCALVGISGQTIGWAIAILVVLVFAVQSPISALPYHLRIPFISSMQPTRLLCIVDFCLSVLAAYGLSNCMRRINIKRVLFIFVCIGVVIAGLWMSVYVPSLFSIPFESIDVVRRNIILPSMITGLLMVLVVLYILVQQKIQWAGTVFGIILVGISIFDMYRCGWKFTPFTNQQLFFRQTDIISYLQQQQKPFRVASTDDTIMPPNVNGYYGIELIGGYDPFIDNRYEMCIAAMERGEANIAPPYGFNRIINPKNIYSPLFSLFGVRYVLSISDIANTNFSKVMQEGQTRLYEYKNVLPRAFLASSVRFASNVQQVFDTLYSKEFVPTDAIVEQPLDISSEPLVKSEQAFITSYTGQSMQIETTVEKPRVLVILNSNIHGWKTEIDGKTTSIFPVNYCMIGVVVPKGKHTISVHYE